MESNEIVREQIFEIIKNQMKDNNPPETNQTFNRLVDLGYSEDETKKLIANCLAVEIFNILKHKKQYDLARYIQNLNLLPKLPEE